MFSLYSLSFFFFLRLNSMDLMRYCIGYDATSDWILKQTPVEVSTGFQLERVWSACLFLVICQHPLGYHCWKNKTWGFQWISSASSFPRKGRGCNTSRRWHQLCPDFTFNNVTTWWWRRTEISEFSIDFAQDSWTLEPETVAAASVARRSPQRGQGSVCGGADDCLEAKVKSTTESALLSE